jgi:hypothetical protein
MEIFQTSLDKYEQQETKETTNKLVYLAQKNILHVFTVLTIAKYARWT